MCTCWVIFRARAMDCDSSSLYVYMITFIILVRRRKKAPAQARAKARDEAMRAQQLELGVPTEEIELLAGARCCDQCLFGAHVKPALWGLRNQPAIAQGVKVILTPPCIPHW